MKSVKDFENFGRKAWLAGLGSLVFGKEYATAQFDKVYTETGQIISNLMSAGEKFSESEDNKFPAVDERITQIREKLGLDNKQPNQLQELEQRVAHLTDVVNKLVEKKSEDAAPAPKTRKPRVSRTKAATPVETDKAETASTAKETTTAKKTTARKPAVRKTPAAKKETASSKAPAAKKATTTRRAPAKKPATKAAND
ncbi:hypothetical protein EYS14_11995 [Alteromonadaceae bacterium M269]|nr:hypothetical protein EYS14_11995 [Alteromonadaceae bacterium M269]